MKSVRVRFPSPQPSPKGEGERFVTMDEAIIVADCGGAA